MGAFKAYDIRGIYNEDFTSKEVYSIGFFIPELLKADKVLVGRDNRLSSEEMFESLVSGITDAGADVYDTGLATTPLIYFGTAKFGFNASVQITASHNPKEYNGLKISKTNCIPVGYDTGLGLLESWVKTKPIYLAAEKGKVINFDAQTAYLAFLQQYKLNNLSFPIAIDCSNGMASLFVKEVFGNRPYYLFDTLDGSFPNHEPNPLESGNTEALRHFVKEKQCKLGVIFDGDADRVMFVDETGTFISPDLMIAIAGKYFSEKKLHNQTCDANYGCDSGKKPKALIDIRTSKAVRQYLERLGFEVEMWRVGRAYAAIKLREIDGLFGGELAGHYYFRDFYYSDSGLLAALIHLNVLGKEISKGRKVSEIIGEITAGFYNSGEINFRIEAKTEAMDAIRKHFCREEMPVAFYDFDGYRVEFKSWWFNIRLSNTEPYLRFIAEANHPALLEEKIRKVKEILGQIR